MFTATIISRTTDPFGLGYLYEVEFSNEDGSIKHNYFQEGRSIIEKGVKQFVRGLDGRSLEKVDCRIQAPNLDALKRACAHHCEQFELVAADAEQTVGAVDLTDVRPKPPVSPSADVLAAQKAQQVLQQAVAVLKLTADINAAKPGTITDDHPSVVAAKADLDANADAVLTALTDQAVATKARLDAAISVAPVEAIKG